MTAAFHQATTVELTEPPTGLLATGLLATGWRASLPPSWDVPTGVHGGVLLATTLRAATAAMVRAEPGPSTSDELSLRHAHASFLSRPAHHDLEGTAVVTRRGRTTGHVRATARAAGDAADALDVVALYARPRPSADAWVDVDAPSVSGPGEGGEIDRRHWPMPPPPLFGHFEATVAHGRLPGEEGWGPDQPARYGRWTRYREAPLLADGTIDPLALLPLADLPGPSVWCRFGVDEDLRVLVSLELTVDVLEPVRDEWVLSDFHARWLGEGYVVVDCDQWSAGRLVACCRQTMLVRTVPRGGPL